MSDLPAPDRGKEPGEVVGFLDLGTNSVRLLLARIEPGHGYTVITQQKEAVRLGEGEFSHQYLQVEAMNRAVLVCKKFHELARSYGAREVIAVATSATREAKNQRAFLTRLEREAGLGVHVVSGREEARLVYLGVISGLHLAERTAWVMDVGGGSTEFIFGDQRQHRYLDSLKLGAIRLSHLYTPDGGVVSNSTYSKLQQHIRSSAVRISQKARQFKADWLIGSSGSVINLADIAVRRYLGRRRQRDDVITFQQVQEVMTLLRSLTLAERKRVPGINPERADILIAGAAIVHTLMPELECNELRVSERGLRDGLLMDYLSRSEQGREIAQMSVRRRSVLQLGRSCGFHETHAQHVARLALELFDSAREAGLHKLRAKERELLEYAALLHDIGAFLSYDNHHEHSYYLIRNADLLGFDQTEQATIATTALFHRKALPRRKHPAFDALDPRSQKTVRILGLLLRIAESLDRSRGSVIKSAILLVQKDRCVLKLRSEGDSQLELWGVQNQREAFEKTLSMPLMIEVEASVS